MFVGRVIVCIGMLLCILLTQPVFADNTNETSIEELQQKIQQLENQVAQYKQKVNQLEIENEKLKSKINELEKWDARKLMDKLLIYHITPQGKQYELLFHEGGLGGVAVYQYVGPWMGDAGKWRQYKQIAQLKTTQLEHGYLKPGIELKPVWGFEKKNITIRTISDIIKLERELSYIDGLAKYFDWIRWNYLTASKFNLGVIGAAILIALVVGMVLGEVITPIRKLADRVTVGAMTYWGQKRRRIPVIVIVVIGCLFLGLFLTTYLPMELGVILTITVFICVSLVCKITGIW